MIVLIKRKIIDILNRIIKI
jgi:hypothetical protein